MKTKDFSFNLPEELIAQYPAEKRELSRLLVLNPKNCSVRHKTIQQFPGFVDHGSVIVINNTRVRKARVRAHSESGGHVEVLFVKKIGPFCWKVTTNKTKKQRKGKTLFFPGDVSGMIEMEEGLYRIVRFSSEIDDIYLEKYGAIPLPPYIKRPVENSDEERYQTIFSKEVGSMAAPTAGLHFTNTIVNELKKNGIEIVTITLNVGLGTFMPIRAERIEDHTMHSEEYVISDETAQLITKAKQNRRNVIAIGTTTVRTLESAWYKDRIVPGKGLTDLYIKPGFDFQVTDQLLTNFHTPESSLLVMVSAFAGKDCIKHAYDEAIKRKYRFFSYGDAMFITAPL